MARRYQANTTVVATAAGFVFQRVLGGNPQRLSLFFSGDVNATVKVNDSDGGISGRCFVIVGTFGNAPIAYRDFGTLMQGEIWVATNPAVTNLSVIEIVKVGV